MNRSTISIVLIIITVLIVSIYINWDNLFKSDSQEIKKDVNQIQIAEIPISAVNKRLVVVSQDGSGNYRAIQAALDRSQPGDTIQVKNGVYRERVNFHRSGTRELPITLINYPDHRPIIDPGGGAYPSECCPSVGSPRVEFNAEWVILKGFEIRYGWDGVKLYKGHNTVRNNWIHTNKNQGILIVSSGNILIDKNIVEDNGIATNTCMNNGISSPKLCHGIYISDYYCNGAPNIIIRDNVVRNQGGQGIQWNAKGCKSEISGNLVENNLIMNNAIGMALYHNITASIIRNNIFVTEWYPPTNQSEFTFLSIYNSRGNIFRNNVFYTIREDVQGIVGKTPGTDKNEFENNSWYLKNDIWKWNGAVRSDFRKRYRSVSGDVNGKCCDRNSLD